MLNRFSPDEFLFDIYFTVTSFCFFLSSSSFGSRQILELIGWRVNFHRKAKILTRIVGYGQMVFFDFELAMNAGHGQLAVLSLIVP